MKTNNVTSTLLFICSIHYFIFLLISVDILQYKEIFIIGIHPHTSKHI